MKDPFDMAPGQRFASLCQALPLQRFEAFCALGKPESRPERDSTADLRRVLAELPMSG